MLKKMSSGCNTGLSCLSSVSLTYGNCDVRNALLLLLPSPSPEIPDAPVSHQAWLSLALYPQHRSRRLQPTGARCFRPATIGQQPRRFTPDRRTHCFAPPRTRSAPAEAPGSLSSVTNHHTEGQRPSGFAITGHTTGASQGKPRCTARTRGKSTPAKQRFRSLTQPRNHAAVNALGLSNLAINSTPAPGVMALQHSPAIVRPTGAPARRERSLPGSLSIAY